jgi:hypothetical protein
MYNMFKGLSENMCLTCVKLIIYVIKLFNLFLKLWNLMKYPGVIYFIERLMCRTWIKIIIFNLNEIIKILEYHVW